MTDDPTVEAVARAIAEELYPFDECHRHKAHWVETGGMLNGSFRDVSGPFQSDYLDMAHAAIATHNDAKDAEIERLRAALEEAFELLDTGQGGYIPGCREFLQWGRRRDSLLEALNRDR